MKKIISIFAFVLALNVGQAFAQSDTNLNGRLTFDNEGRALVALSGHGASVLYRGLDEKTQGSDTELGIVFRFGKGYICFHEFRKRNHACISFIEDMKSGIFSDLTEGSSEAQAESLYRKYIK